MSRVQQKKLHKNTTFFFKPGFYNKDIGLKLKKLKKKQGENLESSYFCYHSFIGYFVI